MSTSKELIWQRKYKVLSLLKIQKKAVGTQCFLEPKCRYLTSEWGRMRSAASMGAIIHAGGFNLSCLIYFLAVFTCLSFRLSRFAPSFPFPKLPLSFLTFVIGEDVRENAPGNGFDGVLWNAGIVHEFLFAAQVFFFPSGSIWNFQGTDVRTVCSGWHGSFHVEQKMQTPVKPKPSVCLHLLFCYATIISAPTWPVKGTWNVE